MSVGGSFTGVLDEFCLHDIPGCWFDDRWIVTGHVVLGYFTFIDFHGFGQEIGGVSLFVQLQSSRG